MKIKREKHPFFFFLEIVYDLSNSILPLLTAMYSHVLSLPDIKL